MEELRPSQRPGSSFEALGDDDPVFATDDFRMFAMKVTPCTKRFVHDWVTCPLSHPGEKAKRRDPRKSGYTGIACPAMKKAGMCHRSDQCPYAHNVFEYWLHPTRYRTQLCNDGLRCRRRVCFFAHTLEELRVPSTKPFVAPEALAAIDQAAGNNGSPQHGAAVQGQMLGPTLAPEQQEALMHILMALQQSGEALPQQDLDTVQAEGRRLEQLYSVNATDPFAGMSTPVSLHTTSGGSMHGGRFNNNNNSVSAHSGSAASAHSGFPSRMASLNASSSYGMNSMALGSGEGLISDADAIQALNHRLASLQRSGGSGDDREAVVGLLQRMLSGGLGTPPLQSHSSASSRDFDADMTGMFAANSGYAGLHQSSSPHYSVGSGSTNNNKFSPDPRAYLASSLYAPSGATSAYQVSPARSSRVSSEYDRSGHAAPAQGRLSLQEDMRPLPDGGTGYQRRRSLQVDDWRLRPGILNSYGTVNPTGSSMPQQQQQLSPQQQQAAAMLLGVNGGPKPVAGYGSHEEVMATPFHGGRPSNAVPQWQWPAQYPQANGPAGAVAGMRAALSAPGSVHASSSGSGYEVRFSGEFPHVQAAMGRSDSLLEGLQEHPPALNIHPQGSGSPPRGSPQPDTNRSSSSAARSSPGIASLVDQFQDLQTGVTASPQPRGAGVPLVASPSGHSRPPMPPGSLGSGRMSFDFARAPGDGRRMGLSGMPPPGSRSPSIDLSGGSYHSMASLQGVQQPDQGTGQVGGGAERPGSAQSA